MFECFSRDAVPNTKVRRKAKPQHYGYIQAERFPGWPSALPKASAKGTIGRSCYAEANCALSALRDLRNPQRVTQTTDIETVIEFTHSYVAGMAPETAQSGLSIIVGTCLLGHLSLPLYLSRETQDMSVKP